MRSPTAVCQGCGQPIWGEYLRALGATWHPEHFLCAGCHRPIGNDRFLLHENAPYHSECYARFVAPHCAYCGRPLMGKYLIDHWGTKYCEEHQSQYPACVYCGRRVPPEQQERGKDVVRCPICRSSAIETIAEAKPLFARVKGWISSQGLRYNNLPLSFELCDRQRLAEHLHERNQTHSMGATTSARYMENGRVVRSEVNGIAVLQGLPATLFQGVTAHELGHVWLVVQSIYELPDWAEEGFCELLSYRYYHDLHTPESLYYAESIERNLYDVYREGFQRVQALANAHGFPQLLEILHTTKRLPAR